MTNEGDIYDIPLYAVPQAQDNSGDGSDATSQAGYKPVGTAPDAGLVERFESCADAGWVPVSERLPEDGQQVWVSFKDYGQGYAIYQNNEWFFDVTDYGDLLSRADAIKNGLTPAIIEHWMPLPTAPERKE